MELSYSINVRTQMSDTILQLQRKDLPSLITLIVNTLSDAKMSHACRSQAAIILLNTLQDFLNITDQILNATKTEAGESHEVSMIAVKTETVECARYQLCGTVSDFAFTHLESNVWSEILPKLSALVMSTNSPKRAVALKILAAMVPVIMTTLEKNAEQLANIVKSCMAASELDVR